MESWNTTVNLSFFFHCLFSIDNWSVDYYQLPNIDWWKLLILSNGNAWTVYNLFVIFKLLYHIRFINLPTKFKIYVCVSVAEWQWMLTLINILHTITPENELNLVQCSFGIERDCLIRVVTGHLVHS